MSLQQILMKLYLFISLTHTRQKQYLINNFLRLYFGSVETLKYKPTKSLPRSRHVFLEALGDPGTKLQCLVYAYRRYTYH